MSSTAEHDGDTADTGHWEQGLWAASAEGATPEAAQAAALAEYQED